MAVLAVLLVPLGTAACTDQGSPNETATGPGPLAGDADVKLSVPLEASDTGFAWGNQIVRNTGKSVITLRTVDVLPQSAATFVTSIYVFGPERVDIAQEGSLAGAQLPSLPSNWRKVPKRPVTNYQLAAAGTDATTDRRGAELVVEFKAPQQRLHVTGLRVTYTAAGATFTKDFQNDLTICPPLDRPCSPS